MKNNQKQKTKNKKTKIIMAIKIKYQLDENSIKYNNFREIKRLTNYNDIVYINCNNNQLTKLPSILPASLQKLDCYYNELIELPSKLPDSLQVLECSANQLTELPSDLPASLQVLECSRNQLTELPSDLPISLQELFCSNNHLTKLPSNLPGSLQNLTCYYNELTELPSNLHELRNLYYINYSNNQIEYIPPHITRFLNRLIDTNRTKIYDDGQNVHNHQIQESIRNSVFVAINTDTRTKHAKHG